MYDIITLTLFYINKSINEVFHYLNTILVPFSQKYQKKK
ncbi:hypothetical protein OIU84_012547, partial [Salix udensis]